MTELEGPDRYRDGTNVDSNVNNDLIINVNNDINNVDDDNDNDGDEEGLLDTASAEDQLALAAFEGRLTYAPPLSPSLSICHSNKYPII